MLRETTQKKIIDIKISDCIKQVGKGKEDQLTELVIEILVELILNRCHEESNQTSVISSLG